MLPFLPFPHRPRIAGLLLLRLHEGGTRYARGVPEARKSVEKIHLANIKAGKYNFWELTKIVSPSGDEVEYNYITRINFKGEKQLAEYFENWSFPDLETILTAEEIALVNRSNEIRTRVKSEIWAHVDMAAGENIDKANIAVVNYFEIPEESSQAEHLQTEMELWKPVHEARCKDSKMSGWILIRQVLPFGSALAYHNITVDLYPNMEAYLSNSNPISYFEKFHAGKDLEKLYAQSDAAAHLIRADVKMVLDDSDRTDLVAKH